MGERERCWWVAERLVLARRRATSRVVVDPLWESASDWRRFRAVGTSVDTDPIFVGGGRFVGGLRRGGEFNLGVVDCEFSPLLRQYIMCGDS